MASSGPSVSVTKTAAGDYSIGVTVDGVFVPFATKNGSYVDAKVAKGKALKSTRSKSTTEDE